LEREGYTTNAEPRNEELEEAIIAMLAKEAPPWLERCRRAVLNAACPASEEVAPQGTSRAACYMAAVAEGDASEGELIRRLLDRDEAAFLELVGRHQAGLLRLARSFVKSEAAALEAVQETWQAFLEGLPTFEQRSSLKTFLYRIVANRARTRAVRDGRSTPLSQLEADGDEQDALVDRFGTTGKWTAPPTPWAAETAHALIERREAVQALAAALERLPDRQRLVIQLRDIDGLSSAQASDVLGITEVHLRVLLHRARAALRAQLEAFFSA